MPVYNPPLHPMAIALCVCIWALDIYLILAGIRVLLSWLSAYWAKRVAMKLAPFTDPILHAVRDTMVMNRVLPPLWLAYIVVLLTGAMLRHTFLWVAVRLH